jgi:hypothetical protein
MKTIKQEADDYINAVVPKDAGKAQIRVTRLAFYSGVFIILHSMLKLPKGNDHQAADALEAWYNETRTFINSHKS